MTPESAPDQRPGEVIPLVSGGVTMRPIPVPSEGGVSGPACHVERGRGAARGGVTDLPARERTTGNAGGGTPPVRPRGACPGRELR